MMQCGDKRVKTTIWDTAGQERYRSLAPMYYRGAAAAVVVYDVTNKDSFNGAKSWVKELQRRGDPNVVIALAGNKADLEQRRKGRRTGATGAALLPGALAGMALDRLRRVDFNPTKRPPRPDEPGPLDMIRLWLRARAGRY